MVRKRRGAALLSGLMITALMLIFVFTITDLAIFHYQTVQTQEEMLQAREAAQAGLSETVRRLSTDPSFGLTGQSVTGDTGAANYTVTFATTDPRRSTNNLAGFNAVPGWGGRSVPAHCALIVSKGTSRGKHTRTIEAVVHLEALPFPLQSTARIEGDSITVGGAASLQDFVARGAQLPGSIYSGSTVNLGGVGTVSGDIRVVTDAFLGPGMVLTGKLEKGVAPLQVPNLNIGSFDTFSTPGRTLITSGTYNMISSPLGGTPGVHRLTGTVYVEGDVHLIGPLQLDQATVFVANGGNFRVDGPVLGQGSLFVTGETKMLAGTVLKNDQQIAIFSQNDLEVSAGGFFQGVLYSHGKVKTGPGVTVLGAIVAQNNTDDADLGVGATGKVIHLPEYTAFASYWLARGAGGAPVKMDYWGELP